MKRSTVNCQFCNRAVSKSNIRIHELSCAPNACEELKERRREIAKLANAASIEKKQLRRENNIQLLPFDQLNNAEKRIVVMREQNHKCAECGIDEIWNNKPLKFDLDHVSGDRLDETRGNLRFLCPNCHSQTPTYKTGNNPKPGKKKYSDEEIVAALKSNTSGYQAIKSLGMNPHGGHYKKIRRLIAELGLELPYTV